ncbi:MAG: bifunctional phosphoribosyl-AMP cyclohydrolase/phosphoribosyl-ATP diphosphatase, partial [Anaerolineae bacterium]
MTSQTIGIRYDSRGLVPTVVQDDATGQVLMVAWMNKEALERTVL